MIYFSMTAGSGLSASLGLRSCLITLIFAFLLGCLLESHNKGSPTHLKEVDDAHAQVFECEHSAHLDQPATLNPIPHLNSLVSGLEPRPRTS